MGEQEIVENTRVEPVTFPTELSGRPSQLTQ